MKTKAKHSFFGRAAAMLLTVIIAFAGAQTARANDAVTYIDMNGATQTVTEYTEVTSDMTADQNGYIIWTTGTYVVKSDVTLSGCIRFDYPAVIDLIVCDGKTLTVNGNSNGAFYGNTLNIYAQSTGTGMGAVNAKKQTKCNHLYIAGGTVTLDADGASYGLYIFDGSNNGLTVNGGDVTILNNNQYDGAIYFDSKGSVTLNGGKLTVTNNAGNSYRAIEGRPINTINFNSGTAEINGKIDKCGYINLNGGNVTVKGGIDSEYDYTVTYDFTRTTDSYNIKSFDYDPEDDDLIVQVSDGKALKDPSGNIYYGTLNDAQISAIANVTLQPASEAEFIAAALPQTGTNEYTISDAAGWTAFCLALQDNAKGIFSGKTVKLGADITVSRMAGASNHDFTGTFDGQGHTLTLNYGTADSRISEQYAAPFRYMEGGRIENLHVAGTIYTAAKNAAGLISRVPSSGNTTTTIENCRISVTINSTFSGDGTHGGLVASQASSSTINITGCVFDGKLLGETTIKCGGFIGYRNGTATISNSLFAPAEVTVSTEGSATFARNKVDTYNCYYTNAFHDATYAPYLADGTVSPAKWNNGQTAHTIAAGANVTLGHAGEATEYSVSGITAYKATGASGDDDPFIAGILYDDVLYAGSGDAVSLTLTNSVNGDAPLGYKNGYYTVSGGATRSGSTLNMADEDVTISFYPSALRSTHEAVSVSYIDEDGQPDIASAIALDGTESRLDAGWYFVGTDISHSGRIDCYGDVNIILADDKTMTVSGGDDGIENGSSRTLTIYGQTLGTGTLNATGGYIGIFHYSGSVVICGGTVNATGTISVGIYAEGDVTITGGKVTASGNSTGIYANGSVTITGGQVTATGGDGWDAYGINSVGGNITLCCTNFSDYIKVSSYSHLVNIAYGQRLYEEGSSTYYSGEDVTIPDGVTLHPLENVLALDDAADNTAAIAAANDGERRNVILYGRTLYKDGAWNTLCLPFDIVLEDSPLDGDGVDVRTLSSSSFQDGTLTLTFTNAGAVTTLQAGQPYIIKWNNTGKHLTDNDLVFRDAEVTAPAPASVSTDYVDFYGTFSPVPLYESGDEKHYLYLGAGNSLYYPTAPTFQVNAFRALFELKGLTCGEPSSHNAVRAFNLNFADGEASGIKEITDPTPNPSPAWEGSAAWYTLDGVRLDAQPTRKGLYIHGGRKVAIK